MKRRKDQNDVKIYEEVARYNSVYKEVEIKRFKNIMAKNPDADPLYLYSLYICQAEEIVDLVKDVIKNDLYDGLEYNTSRYLNKAALCFREAAEAADFKQQKADRNLLGTKEAAK